MECQTGDTVGGWATLASFRYSEQVLHINFCKFVDHVFIKLGVNVLIVGTH
jgi:hypothetical protein